MFNLTHFKPTLLTLSLTAFFTTAYAYQQGSSAVATVEKGETVTKIDSVTSNNPKSGVAGELNRSGNPVRIIWYGNENDQDSKIAQTGALNDGIIHGKVIAQGKRSNGGKDEKWASVNVEGQGNAIDALGWSAPTNPRDIDITIKTVENHRTAIGEASLKGGLSTVHGDVSSLGSANGISIMGTADFGSSSGIDGVSGATGKSASASVSANVSGPSLEDLLSDASETVPADTSEADLHGKSVQIKLEKVENKGELVGNLHAQASQEIKRAYTAEYAPQFYGVNALASGNGISVASYVDTPDKYTYSENKLNSATLGTVENRGSIKGQSLLEGGQKVTHTQTMSKGSANGISAYAITGRFAKNSTSSQIEHVNNHGFISGSLHQISGNNSGYQGNLLLSSVETYGSGNGVSAFTESFNGQTQYAKSEVGDIVNSGKIIGSAYLKAGTKGTGDMNITSAGSGNGISSYTQKGNAITGHIDNTGMIFGNVESRPGTQIRATTDGSAIPEQEVRLLITSKENRKLTPNVLPEKPAQTRALTNSEKQNLVSANSDIVASGNGISTLQRNNETAYMGNITNSGVISGYAKLYHGFANENYKGVRFLGAGTGIFLSNQTKYIHNNAVVNSDIINTGIISGNHSALLVKGKINTAYSIFNPSYEAGYTGKVENYGLMAGAMMAGNYNPTLSGSALGQSYTYFEADKDPIKNAGTYVYLKSGFSTVMKQIQNPWLAYPSSSLTVEANNDYEHIDRVVVGTASSQYTDKQGNTYRIINGDIATNGKDSDYQATSDLTNVIVNGVGIANGAVYTSGSIAIKNSIINGYRTALNLKENANVNVSNSHLNANGFNVNRTLAPYAVLGDEGQNHLVLANKTQVNGNINLQEGDDTLTIQDYQVKMNGAIMDLGDGQDKVIFGNAKETTETPISVDYQIANAEEVEVLSPTKILATAKINGTDKITLKSNLIYQADNETRHALYDTERTKPIELNGNGTFIADVTNQDQTLKFGGFNLTDNGQITYKTTNVLQTAELREGQIHIKDKTVEEELKKAEQNLIDEPKKLEEAPPLAEEMNTPQVDANSSQLANSQPQETLTEPTHNTQQKVNTDVLPATPSKETQPLMEETNKSETEVNSPQLADSHSQGTLTEPTHNAEQKVKTDVLPAIPSKEKIKSDQTFINNLALLEKTKAGTTFLENSASIKNKGQDLTTSNGLAVAESMAKEAINQYVEAVQQQNIYAILPNIMLDSTRHYRNNTLDNARKLNKNQFMTQISTQTQHNRYQEVANKASSQMLMMNFAYGTSDHLTLGIHLGVGKEKIDGHQSSYLKGHSIYASAYTHATAKQFGLTTGIAYEQFNLKGKRYISNGYDNHQFEIKSNPKVLSLFTEAKYSINVNDYFTYEPKVGLAYNRLQFGQIREQGNGALNIANYYADNLEFSVGQNFSINANTTHGTFKTTFSTDYIQSTQPKTLNAHFQHGNNFTLYNEKDNHKLRLGLTTRYQSKSGFAIGLGTSVDTLRKAGNAWNASLSIGYNF